MPVLLLLFTALLAGGAILFQVGRASGLSASAQTGADAAALAAAKNMRIQLMTMAANGVFGRHARQRRAGVRGGRELRKPERLRRHLLFPRGPRGPGRRCHAREAR